MARFLIGTVPAIGHINPALPIARTLVERGHEVWWYTGQRFRAKVDATGAHYVPMSAAPDFDDRDLDIAFPGRRGLTGLAQLKWDLKYVFIDSSSGQLTDCLNILRAFPADVFLADTVFAGAGATYEKGGPPWAVFGISALALSSRDTAPFGLALPPDSSPLGRVRNRGLHLLFNHVIFRDVITYTNTVRAQLGLPVIRGSLFDAGLSPFLYLQGTVPEFEYPRSDLPPQVHFVGLLTARRPIEFTPPPWWHDLTTDRPVVHVTQGTLATDVNELIVPTLQALAHENVLVIATTGDRSVTSVTLDPLPTNARIAQFIPYEQLLPHVNVMVTNGGYGGVQLALSHGIPLVAAGATEEKPEICARIAWAGVGINLKTNRPAPDQVRDAIHTLLTDSRYRQKARQIQAAFNAHDGPTEAAMLLEKLAATKQPVLR